MNNMASTYWSKLYKNFDNKICNNCRKTILKEGVISLPQPIPFVGSDFDTDEYKMMFVGIETWGNDEYSASSSDKISIFETETTKNYYESGYSPFWVWMKDIASRVLKKGNDSLSHIAYSNLLKCQAREDELDKYSFEYFPELCSNCIQKQKWIFNEISCLNARNVIIFSGTSYSCALMRHFLDDIDGESIKTFDFSEHTLTDNQKQFSKNFPFVHLQEKDTGRRIILTIHPGCGGKYFPTEMKQIVKEEIINIISNNIWRNSTSWSRLK